MEWYAQHLSISTNRQLERPAVVIKLGESSIELGPAEASHVASMIIQAAADAV